MITTRRNTIGKRARAVTVAVSAAVVTLLVALLGGTASGSVRPAVSCGNSWAMVPSSAVVKDPRGIAVIGQNDVWVVGVQVVPSAKVHPAAEHWDGSAWTLVSTPFSGLGENALNGVSAVSSDDVWAVGYWQPEKKVSAAFNTLTEHWDGTSWSVVPSPTVPSSGSNTLTSVTALSDHNVWAVGYYFDSKGVRKTLIEHYDGADWSIVPSPNPGGVSDALLGVTGVAAGDVWAVGFTSAGFGYDALLLHYDGGDWTQVSGAADPSSAEDVLAGVAQDGSGDVWAFGYHVIGSDYRTLAEHWNGSSWSISPTTNGTDGVVTVVRGGSVIGDDVWAAGFDYRVSDGRYKEYTEHFDGSSWTSFPGAMSTNKDKSEMYAVAHVPGTDQVWSSARTAHLELICPGSFEAGSAAARAGVAPAGHGRKFAPTPGILSVPGRPYRIPGVVRPLASSAPVPNVPIPHAADVATAAGIFENTLTHGGVTADFNGDGWPDIFLNRHMDPAKLYINDHDGTFTLTDFGTFPHRDRHGCASADVNGDGRLDLFCNTGSDRGTEAKRDELWIQQASGDFQEKASQYGVLQPFDRGRISGFIDADNDGRPDVYAANFPDRADGMPSSNRLFLNQGGTSYRLASEFGLDRELNGSTISVGDYDNDGYQDLLLCGSGGIHLYHNDGGEGFTEVSHAMGLDHRANAAAFADFDRDGKLDVVEVNKTRLQIDLQRGGSFVSGPVQSGLLSGFKLAVGDVNNDNWPDVYVEQANQGSNKNVPDVVFLNNGSGDGFAATSVTVPGPSSKGAAEDVVSIDFNRDGYMDFLVENGNSTKAGSVQLIEFTP
jgi:hypothetical protein